MVTLLRDIRSYGLHYCRQSRTYYVSPPPPPDRAHLRYFLLRRTRQENYRKWREGKDMAAVDRHCLFQPSISVETWENHLYQDSSCVPSPNEDGFCSSEIKHDRRTAPRPEMFVSARRLQKQRPRPRNFLPRSSPSEDCFFSLETKHDRRKALGICEDWSICRISTQ
jgi:hypothetical protein